VYGYKISKTKYLDYKGYTINNIPDKYTDEEYMLATQDDKLWDKFVCKGKKNGIRYIRTSQQEYLKDCFDDWINYDGLDCNDWIDDEKQFSVIFPPHNVLENDGDNLYVGIDVARLLWGSSGVSTHEPFGIPPSDSLDNLDSKLYDALSDESKKNGPMLWTIQIGCGCCS